MNKRWTVLAAVSAMMLTLSGCLFRSPDDLYQLPAASAGYEQLTGAIAEVKNSLSLKYNVSAEDASILSGTNTATIQLQDLDGDGERESAVTFLRVPGVEKAIKIYIFTLEEGAYHPAAVVEGDGTAINSVDYVDLNGTGCKELVVNWQISTGVYQLGAYTLDELAKPAEHSQTEHRSDLRATELLLTRCSSASDGSSASGGYQLLDLDQDTRTEIAVVRIDSSGVGSGVEVFGWEDGAFVSLGSANLSTGVTGLNRIRSNYLNGDQYLPALYVTGELSDGRKVIDVVAYQDGLLTNVSLDKKTGVSREILQGYTEVSPTDINGDYVLELPTPTALPSSGDGSTVNFWLIDWGQYDQRGARSHVLTTYHNVADGWYLVVPEGWRDKITMSRNDQVNGQREVIFSLWQGAGQAPVPFLSLYRLTGSSRSVQATEAGRFVLREDENVIYAAQFYDCGWDCGLDEAGLLENFHTIQNSWYGE